MEAALLAFAGGFVACMIVVGGAVALWLRRERDAWITPKVETHEKEKPEQPSPPVDLPALMQSAVDRAPTMFEAARRADAARVAYLERIGAPFVPAPKIKATKHFPNSDSPYPHDGALEDCPLCRSEVKE